MNPTSENIWRIFVNKRHRAGALPSDNIKRSTLDIIEQRVCSRQPIAIFQFWGGCKNPNLPEKLPDSCEEATLRHLSIINEEVKKVYPPGLNITVFPGDERISCVNMVPKETTQAYVRSLVQMAETFDGLFSIVPVSELYQRYAYDYQSCLKKAMQKVSENIFNHTGFSKLEANARKNIYRNDLNSDDEISIRSRKAARDYIVYRIAEEEAKIFREYSDSIRFSFIRFSPFYAFYKMFISNIEMVRPRLDSVLHFYTGSKGNITQPWQAIGLQNNGSTAFLSQEKLHDAKSMHGNKKLSLVRVNFWHQERITKPTTGRFACKD